MMRTLGRLLKNELVTGLVLLAPVAGTAWLVYAIAFVTAEHAGAVLSPDGKELVSVFVPTTPNPTSGFFLLVDKGLMRELDMPVQQAFKLVVTMGIAKEPEILTTTAKLSRKTL